MPKAAEDIARLVANQRSLLETIPEMVLLVKNPDSIEFMNPNAVKFFGDLCDKRAASDPEKRSTIASLLRVVAWAINEKRSAIPRKPRLIRPTWNTPSPRSTGIGGTGSTGCLSAT